MIKGVDRGLPRHALSEIGNAKLIEIRAQTWIFPDEVVGFIRGFFHISS